MHLRMWVYGKLNIVNDLIPTRSSFAMFINNVLLLLSLSYLNQNAYNMHVDVLHKFNESGICPSREIFLI